MNSLSPLSFALTPPSGHALLPPCYHGFHAHMRGPLVHAPLLEAEPAFVRRRNERERERVRHVNQGYARLRQLLPQSGAEPRLSKVQTLRAAIRYIGELQRLLTASRGSNKETPASRGSNKETPASRGSNESSECC